MARWKQGVQLHAARKRPPQPEVQRALVPPVPHACPCRAARLAALGLLHGAHERWQQRLAALDALVTGLGPPAVHALLALAPSAAAAATLAEAALPAAGGCGGEGGGSGAWRENGGHASSSSSTGSWTSSSSGGHPAAALEGSPGQQLGPEVASAVRWWFGRLRAGSLPARAVRALQARGLDCLLQQRVDL